MALSSLSKAPASADTMLLPELGVPTCEDASFVRLLGCALAALPLAAVAQQSFEQDAYFFHADEVVK